MVSLPRLSMVLLALLTLLSLLAHGQPPFEATSTGLSCATRNDILIERSASITRGVQEACSGYIRVPIDGGDVPTCASRDGQPYNDFHAQKICYSLGHNLHRPLGWQEGDPGQIMLYICSAFTETERRVSPPMFVSAPELPGGRQCTRDIKGQCFHECYGGQNVAEHTTVTPRCVDGMPQMAIACVDVNECINGGLFNCSGSFPTSCVVAPPCVQNAYCRNLIGSYTCHCDPGYIEANGEPTAPYYGYAGCIDEDECANDACPPSSQCINYAGYYVCQCPDGTQWNQLRNSCDPSSTINACEDPNQEPNCINGRCVVGADQELLCSCSAGFTGNACETEIEQPNPTMILAIASIALSALLLLGVLALACVFGRRSGPDVPVVPGAPPRYTKPRLRLTDYARPNRSFIP